MRARCRVRSNLSSLCLLIGLGLMAALADPALAKITIGTDDAKTDSTVTLGGRWIASDGAVLTIMQRGDVIQLWGSDRQTAFSTNCARVQGEGPARFLCSGRGYNFVFDTEFFYSSHLQVNEQDPALLKESWEATLPPDTPGDERSLKGEQEFRRQ